MIPTPPHMSLTDLWKSKPEIFKAKAIHQILAFAGDGALKDNNPTSLEFRELLTHVPSDSLAEFANQCLDTSFKDSGLVLQDLVNQIGKRLGFKVQAGRYRGTVSSEDVGFDGLWISPDGEAIVIEVKTTDAYRMSLDTVASYRKKLAATGIISEERSSILYIVGRNDTGDLEAQVRGSRHAWDIRLISLEWLLRLMKLKEELEDPKIIDKIRDVLTPREFTRVDGIIDLVFSTAVDVKKDDVLVVDDDDGTVEEDAKEKKFTPVAFRTECVDRISKHFGETLVRRSAAIFSTPNESVGVVCAISKEYGNPGATNYWFAFHPTQKATLEQFEKAFVCFGCGSPSDILMVPRETFFSWLPSFNQTVDEDRQYWHVHIFHTDKGWAFHAKSGQEKIPGSSYYLKQ
jgi:hypothetical protein